MSAELVVSSVEVTYGHHRAVDDVSFTIPEGQTLVLLGPSGCGKSSLLNAIAGFAPTTSGSIHIGDRDITDLAPRTRGVGLVFQSHALFPHLTVHDNIAFGLRTRRNRRDRDEVSQRVEWALSLVHLDGFGSRFPRSLSGGEQQRVAVARSLVLQPSCLLMDEPLSSLDARLRREMRFEFRSIKEREQLTMVYVTHDQEEAFALGDQVGVMRAGRLQQVATPLDLYETPKNDFVAQFVGNANLLAAEVAQADASDQCQVRILATGDEMVCRNPHRLTPGTEALVSVRPSALGLQADGTAATSDDGSHSVSATLRLARFMGDTVEVACDVQGEEVRATVPNRLGRPLLELPEGAPVGLRWDRADAVVVPRTEPGPAGAHGQEQEAADGGQPVGSSTVSR
jgi:ABC-type Fe3+/spermidine/putrescine transport system ATPase subunit